MVSACSEKEAGLNNSLDPKGKVPVVICDRDLCVGATVNPSCVRCEIVLCDLCVYRGSECICTARASAFSAASCRKGTRALREKGQITKELKF